MPLARWFPWRPSAPPSAGPGRPSRLPLGRLLRGSGVAIGIALVASTGWEIWRARDAAVSDARILTGNLAQVLGQHVERSFDTVQLLLDLIAREVGPDPGSAGRRSDTTATLAVLTQELPHIAALRVLDATSAEPLFTFVRTLAGPPELDREAHAAHRGRSDRELRVGRPFQDPATQTWLVTVSRRIGGRDGIPGNVAVAHVSLDYILRLFDSVSTGPDSTIALLGRDGRILARRPGQSTFVGQDISGSALFRRYLPLAPAGDYVAPAASDGVVRLFSYRAIEDFPLVLTVGLSETDVLAPWRDDALRHILVALSAGLGLLVLGLLLSREVRRRDAAETAMRASEGRLRLALKAARMWEWELQVETGTVTRSPHRRRCSGSHPERSNPFSTGSTPTTAQASRRPCTMHAPGQFRIWSSASCARTAASSGSACGAISTRRIAAASSA